MGFIYCIQFRFQGNLPKTYFLTSWLRQQSVMSCRMSPGPQEKTRKSTYYMSAGFGGRHVVGFEGSSRDVFL